MGRDITITPQHEDSVFEYILTGTILIDTNAPAGAGYVKQD